MQNMYYIGLDVHKRTISATRFYLDRWMKTLPQPWTAAMEAGHCAAV